MAGTLPCCSSCVPALYGGVHLGPELGLRSQTEGQPGTPPVTERSASPIESWNLNGNLNGDGIAGRPAGARISVFLREALEHHQAGRLDVAEQIYGEILTIGPHADALRLAGLIAYETGRYTLAVERLGAAVALRGGVASYYSDLGAALQTVGQLKEAEVAYQQALALKPDCAEAHVNLGIVLQTEGRLEEATAHCREATVLKPQVAEIWMNLGSILEELGRVEESARRRRIFRLRSGSSPIDHPGDRVADSLDGSSCSDLAKESTAEQGAILSENRLEEAVVCFERALQLKPEMAAVHYNLGNALHALDRLEEAEASYERAVALDPDYAKAYHNLGCVLCAQGRHDTAFARYRQALLLTPADVQCNFSAAVAQLQCGDFAAGWQGYRWRWMLKDRRKPMRTYRQPLWRGERSTGRVLLWGEQGVGDEIMFAGLVPDALRTGSALVLDCDPRLRTLFARSFGAAGERIQIAAGESGVAFSAHLPLGDLGAIFRGSRAAFSATTSPYLIADAVARERFRARYRDGRRLVGLAWGTNSEKKGRQRTVALSLLRSLFQQEGIRWVSLQYGDHDALTKQADAAGVSLVFDRSVDQTVDLDRFAAQVAAMDLVITIDNSVAHLAGALGVPAWVMLPSPADWRWMLDRDDSPWYRSVRLFRQERQTSAGGGWEAVVERMAAALSQGVDGEAGQGVGRASLTASSRDRDRPCRAYSWSR